MKLSFSTLGCPEWSLDEVIKNAVLYKMDGVELRGYGRQHISPEFSSREREEIKAKFEAKDLKIVCITGYTKFSMEDAKEREKNEKVLSLYLELCKDVGCKNVRTFIGRFPDNKNRNEVYDYIAYSINRVAHEKENSGVDILIELHDELCTGELVKPLLDRITAKNVGILWDVAHSWRAGEEPERTYAMVGNYIRHIHIKNEFRNKEGQIVHCLLGIGNVPIKKCRDLLMQNGYGGYYSLEWERAHHPEMPDLEVALADYCKVMVD